MLGKLGLLFVAALIVGGVVAVVNLASGNTGVPKCDPTSRSIAVEVASRQILGDYPTARFWVCEEGDSGTVQINQTSGPNISDASLQSLCQRAFNAGANWMPPVDGLVKVKAGRVGHYATCQSMFD